MVAFSVPGLQEGNDCVEESLMWGVRSVGGIYK